MPLDDQTSVRILRRAGFRCIQTDEAIFIDLARFGPLSTFICVLVVESVVLAFAYPLTAMFFNPRPIPFWLMSGVCVLAFLVAAGASIGQSLIRADRMQHLFVSLASREIVLPERAGEHPQTKLAFDDVLDVTAAIGTPSLGPSSVDGSGPQTWHKLSIGALDERRDMGHRSEAAYAVIVTWSDGDAPTDATIYRTGSLPRVRTLTLWFRAVLGLQDPEAVDATPSV